MKPAFVSLLGREDMREDMREARGESATRVQRLERLGFFVIFGCISSHYSMSSGATANKGKPPGKGKAGDKRNYYSSKRPVGGRGIFVTCIRGKESRALAEFMDLLEEASVSSARLPLVSALDLKLFFPPYHLSRPTDCRSHLLTISTGRARSDSSASLGSARSRGRAISHGRRFGFGGRRGRIH